jgi:hypothetical protein
LHRRYSEISGAVSEPEIDRALSSSDPLDALRVLSVREAERNLVMLAVARVRSVEESIKQHERTVERNQAKRARGPSGIITS